MDFIKGFISEYGVTIVYAILTSIAGYIGVYLKGVYEKYIQGKEIEKAVGTAVKAAEQIYKDLHGNDKLAEAARIASDVLEAKGITVSEFELMMLIEATVNEFNNTLWAKPEE